MRSTLRARRAAVASLVTLLAGGALMAMDPSTAAAQEQPTFDCTTDGLLFQGAPSSMELIDMASGESTPGAVLNDQVNAVGYNVLDDYVYGWDLETQSIVRIGSDGSLVDVGVPAGVDPTQRYQTGDVDADGFYWMANVGTGDWYKIDLRPGSPTYGEVDDSGSFADDPALVGFTAGADWAAVPGDDGGLYRVVQAEDGSGAYLFRFDMATGTHQNLGSLGQFGDNHIGAVYTDADGFLYASDNITGEIHRIDVDEVTATFFAQGPTATGGGNDGARCMDAPIPVDFGDAPDSYGTTLASDGARHSVCGYDTTTDTASLMLGTNVSIEPDGQPADGADVDSFDDGVADPIILRAGEPTDVTVAVTNDTDEDATLAGWIDLDGNGVFDPGELVVLPIPAGSGTQDHTLTFPEGTVTGDTYARFRLFGGDATDPQPTGTATCGEVEDYLVLTTPELESEKTADFSNAVPGGTATYTVTLTNVGNGPYTDENPASFTDDLSGVLDDATYNDDASASDGSDVSFADPELSWSGPLAAGETLTVTYSVTIDDPTEGDGELENVIVTPEGNCIEGSDDPLCTTSVLLPELETDKSVDVTDAEPGDTVTYEVMLSNVGEGDFTDEKPASFVDDLSGVLDDATYNDDATASDGSTVSFEDPLLSWAGPLTAGETVTVTYSVTVDDPTQGDGSLNNVVMTTTGNCIESSDHPGCTTSTPAGEPVPEEAPPSPITAGPIPVTD